MTDSKSQTTWFWGTAERGFKRALELNPGYATTHHLYSLLLARLARFPEAIGHAERAFELEPLSPVMRQNLAYVLYLARRYDEALEQCHRTLESAPDLASAQFVLVCCLLQKKNADALVESRKLVNDSGRRPFAVAALAASEAASGNTVAAGNLAEELVARSDKEIIPPFLLAWIYLAAGDTQKALDWLETASARGDDNITFLKVDPAFDSLRAEPRFQNLLQRLQFPE